MTDETPPTRRDCGTMKVHRRLLDTDPNYARRLVRIEEQAFRAREGLMALRPGCTRIPVVVHVVWKTPAQNISQAQIDSQIEVLNRDFRKRNPDISAVPGVFAGVAADARLEFALATRDPQGNAHDGVIRVQTTRDSFDSDDAVKRAASGGSDAWPRDEYLNIWVCQLGAGLLGYAQFPGGPAETDGVVITHTGFGTTGSAAPPFNLGRTTTHEIGHWLNLYHIWGDDGTGCSGSDFVDDTPNQGGSNGGKPVFPTISCNNGPNGDMFMNYMDYVDDDAMMMFTEGQVTRMHACLDGPRSAIGESIPCSGLPKSAAKDATKKAPKEFAKDGLKDRPKEFVKETPKDPPFDPSPKTIVEPPANPKGAMEPPFPPAFPGGTPFPVPGPFGGQMQPPPGAMPFVLATGGPQNAMQPPTAGQMPEPMADPMAGLRAHYAMILQSYAGLWQRGLLDAQGLAAWHQAHDAYRQIGGQ